MRRRLFFIFPSASLIFFILFSVSMSGSVGGGLATASPSKEPFKAFFDYEWWLKGSEYLGKGYQYGKWFVVEGFNPNHDFRITKDNPITGTDSAQLIIDGAQIDMANFAWGGLQTSPDPDRLVYPNMLNPAYMRFRFRIDEWITPSPAFRITIAALGGTKVGAPEQSWSEAQICIGLESNPLASSDNQNLPPHLRLHYRIGDSYDWWTEALTQILISAQEVSIGTIHTLEIMRFGDSVNGMVAVWLDGIQVPDLTVEGLDTSYPGGAWSFFLGSRHVSADGWFSAGGVAGAHCTLTFDDLRIRDEYIGPDPLPITYYDLTLDSSPQGKTVRVGNHVFSTPATIQVPEGTMPKIGVDPTNFDHFEIEPSVDPVAADPYPHNFSGYKETWPDTDPPLISTVTRYQHVPPDNVGPRPMPAIYQDTRITAMYSTGKKHTLNVASDPTVTSFTVDELDYATPWDGSLTEGTHTIVMPSTFTVGLNLYTFKNWEDSSTNPTRTVNLMSDMHITASYDVTTIPEFPTSIAWLAVVGVATLVIVLGVRKMRVHSRIHHHFRSE